MRTLILGFLLISSQWMMAQNTPSDSMITQTRSIGSFDKIKAGKGINVTLTEGKKESLEIRIKNGLPSDVLADLEGKTLNIRMKTQIAKGLAVSVYVTYVKLYEISAGMGSTIDGQGSITADRLVLNAGIDSYIDLEVYVKTLQASVTAGRITLEGTADSQEINSSTGGKFFGENLTSKEAFAKASTGGLIQVNATQKLNANAAAGGKVQYTGNPAKLEKQESFGGKIEELEE